MTDQELIQAAKAMLERSYAPFSHCNIESAAFGATLCAERSAIANAFSHGCRSFVRGAVIADSGDYCTRCGICRQLLYEFSDNLVMLCCKGDGSYLALTAEELLPHGFKAERMT